MTLRDQFAAHAIQTLIASSPRISPQEDEGYLKYIAICAYKYADAMLEARL